MNKIFASLMVLGFMASAHAEPMAMGKITFKYLVDDKGGLTKLEPMNHHMMMSESSPMTVEQSKAMVEKALTQKSGTETLFDAGEMFGKAKAEFGMIKEKVKKGAKKAADTTVSVFSNDKFQKMLAGAFAAGLAAAGGYAAYKSTQGKKVAQEELPEEYDLNQDFDYSGVDF